MCKVMLIKVMMMSLLVMLLTVVEFMVIDKNKGYDVCIILTMVYLSKQPCHHHLFVNLKDSQAILCIPTINVTKEN